MTKDPLRGGARTHREAEVTRPRLAQELAEAGRLRDLHHQLGLALIATPVDRIAVRLRARQTFEVGQRVEPTALAADVVEPERFRQLVSEFAIDLDPRLVRGRFGLQDEPVEVEDERPHAHCCVAYRPYRSTVARNARQ